MDLPPISSFSLEHIIHNSLQNESEQVLECLTNVFSNYQSDLRQELKAKLAIEQKIQYKNIHLGKAMARLAEHVESKRRKHARLPRDSVASLAHAAHETSTLLAQTVAKLNRRTVDPKRFPKLAQMIREREGVVNGEEDINGGINEELISEVNGELTGEININEDMNEQTNGQVFSNEENQVLSGGNEDVNEDAVINEENQVLSEGNEDVNGEDEDMNGEEDMNEGEDMSEGNENINEDAVINEGNDAIHDAIIEADDNERSRKSSGAGNMEMTKDTENGYVNTNHPEIGNTDHTEGINGESTGIWRNSGKGRTSNKEINDSGDSKNNSKDTTDKDYSANIHSSHSDYHPNQQSAKEPGPNSHTVTRSRDPTSSETQIPEEMNTTGSAHFKPFSQEMSRAEFEQFMSSSIAKYRQLQSSKYSFDPFKPKNREPRNAIKLLYSSLVAEPHPLPSVPFSNISVKSSATTKSSNQTSHFKKLRINGLPITSETFLNQTKQACVCEKSERNEKKKEMNEMNEMNEKNEKNEKKIGMKNEINEIKNAMNENGLNEMNDNGLNEMNEINDNGENGSNNGKTQNSDIHSDIQGKPQDDSNGLNGIPSIAHILDRDFWNAELLSDDELIMSSDSSESDYSPFRRMVHSPEQSPTPKHKPSHHTLKPRRSILKTNPTRKNVSNEIENTDAMYERSGISAVNKAYDGGTHFDVSPLVVGGIIGEDFESVGLLRRLIEDRTEEDIKPSEDIEPSEAR